MAIQYKGKDKLYLPIDQMNMVQKYVGSDSKPKVNKLSGSEWSKAKTKAKKAVEEMAYDLVELPREKTKGLVLLVLILHGKDSLKTCSPMRKQKDNCVLLKKSKKIWKKQSQWTDFFVETLDMVRLKWH